jgi:glutaminase
MLSDLFKEDITKAYQKHKLNNDGSKASYIPELLKANESDFAIVITTIDGEVFEVGQSDQTFSLQSLSKPFVYGLALAQNGKEKVLSKVGVEPTGEAFNSIIELEKNTHRPYNPMINSGAIAISSMVLGNNFDERLESIVKLFESYVDHSLKIDEAVFQSEKSTAHRNRAIAHLMAHFNIIENKNDSSIEEALDLYFKQCSILINTLDLSLMAATLANGGIQPKSKKRILSADDSRDILSLMFTCGMYDTAGQWAYSVGLPAKSGVSGGILAVVPGVMGIAAYSPLIDSHGHSIRSVKAITELVTKQNLSIFSGAKK